jgi:hypothetical protein
MHGHVKIYFRTVRAISSAKHFVLAICDAALRSTTLISRHSCLPENTYEKVTVQIKDFFIRHSEVYAISE